MKNEDSEWRRRSPRTEDREEEEEATIVPNRPGFGLAVLVLAAFALGALRRRLARFNERVNRQSYGSPEHGTSRTVVWWVWRDGQGFSSGPYTDPWRFRRTHQFWDEYFEEELKKERMRRMQEAFYKEKTRYTRDFRWQEQPGDWYSSRHWDSSNAHRTTAGGERQQAFRQAGFQRHYEVLGLDPNMQYSEAELKAAFRAKAKQHHPDRNPNRKAEAEEKFKAVVESYEALRDRMKPK